VVTAVSGKGAMNRQTSVSLAIIAGTFLLVSCAASIAFDPSDPPGARPWTLVWSDEFTGPNGSAPDPAKWNLEVGGNGWGNHELEYYTNRAQNAHVEDGSLVIKALKETYTGADGVTREYTSARLSTARRFAQRYGRFEARIKIPYGQGLWTAFWMMGENVDAVGWPGCGEIDIFENVGSEPSTVHGSLHGPGYSGTSALTASYSLPGGQKFADGFHVFAVEWEPNTVRFYVDNNLYKAFTSGDIPSSCCSMWR
jgi:beta-glucanase (GH16 family)